MPASIPQAAAPRTTEQGSNPQPSALPDNAPHLLFVDDDQRIRELTARYLTASGFRVTTAPDAAAARQALKGLAFDLIILDIMMPGEDGLSFARSLKPTLSTPIIMLSARSETSDRIQGLEIGVDDYVPKPFEPRELVLRINAILRRGRPTPQRDDIRMGDYTFNIGRGELKRGAETIKLTERERDLMRQFAQRPGVPVARHELYPEDATGTERAIDVQINRLRRKIEVDPANPVYLQTVRGKGYVLHADER
jgi:two-component system, OmpR family, phosphate regulon response regulator OmpR